ncbi:hypothetical protein [Yinghuangia soli]|uniref:Uncharacterized protein n=1 Tax=Yinghuangia soli TaxID=2908204 RepID=A0AA41U4P5_9ACTN|nr:hypothetical protein [Yinghuangia soli]MCF2533176.1 hypothetical protein [Yinghuangia soli]
MAALDVVLRDARRVHVSEALPHGDGYSLDFSDPAELGPLRAAMAVVSVSDVVCACLGDVRFDFSDALGNNIASVFLHHGQSLQWDHWQGHADLIDGALLLHWLERQGVPAPLRTDEGEETQRRRSLMRAQQDEWLAAAPEFLWDQRERMLALSRTGRLPSQELLVRFARRLKAWIKDPVKRTQALLHWYGAGSGRCSGFPMHECIPAILLRDVPIADIIAALQAPDADASHFAGAVRHLVGWKSRPAQDEDIAALPAALRAELLRMARESGDKDKIARAERLLG